RVWIGQSPKGVCPRPMRIWRLSDPRDPCFARASWRGTWTDGALCPECTSSSERRTKPLIIEWESGSDIIGDFTCTGGWDGLMVNEDAMDKLHRRFLGFERGPVTMIQDKKVMLPKQSRRAQPRIWLPYKGPPLYEIWVTTHVHFDGARTTAKLVRRCSRCD